MEMPMFCNDCATHRVSGKPGESVGVYPEGI